MTVQSAHMITTDYVALSQPLTDGMLLNDRTEHKLKLIHSLGELLPLHTYTTEYGNVLERPSKYKALLAGSIELELTSDEINFDEQMGELALRGEATSSLPNTHMRMASYEAFSKQQHGGADAPSSHAGAHAPSTSSNGAHARGGSGGEQLASSMMTHGQPVDDDPGRGERLREAEALERIASLVARLGEMEEWFESVKGEAERERRMREQSTARLAVMQERAELLTGRVGELQRENALLRRRVADVTAAYEDELDDDRGPSKAMAKPLSSIRGGLVEESISGRRGV